MAHITDTIQKTSFVSLFNIAFFIRRVVLLKLSCDSDIPRDRLYLVEDPFCPRDFFNTELRHVTAIYISMYGRQTPVTSRPKIQ